MGTVTLRPTTVSLVGGATVQGGGTALNAVTDNSDTTSILIYPQNAGFNNYFTTFSLPAGNVVKRIQPRFRGQAVNGAPCSANVIYYGDPYLTQSWTVNSQYSGPALFSDYTPHTYSTDPVDYAVTEANLNGSQLFFQITRGDLVGGYIPHISVYEVYLDVTYAAPPTTSAVTVTPSGTITTTRKPTIGWTYTQGTDGSAQTAFRVKIFTAAQYGAGGFDPATSTAAYDSTQVTSSATSHIPSAFLVNGTTYKAYVQTYQTTNGVNQPSGYVASAAFTISITVPTPTAVTPAASSTQTTSRPTLGASVGAMTGGSTMRREWQFASDSGFTANLLTITEPVQNLTATPSAPFAFPPASGRRAQGTWYIRARALDQDGIYGSYTSGQSFTISHPASASNRTPSGGTTIQYSTTPTVQWTFSDPDVDDYQTKYQVQLWKTSTPGTVLDSGAQTSTNLFYQFTSGIDATWKNTELRWKIQVWDQDNVTAGYSVENTFYMRDLPVVAISAPADSAVITTSAPLITWGNTFSGGATQAQWKVDIIRGSIIATSGWVSSTDTSWQVPSPVVTVGPTHQVTVTVIDSNGLQGSDTNSFTASYAAPTTPNWFIDGSNFAEQGYNLIDWSASISDATFTTWKVMRRNVGDSTWTLLFETTTVGTRQFKDYLAPSLQPLEYVVVQTGISFGVPVESAYVAQQTTGTSIRYLLVCPSLDTLNLVLYQVNADTFADEQESATINLVNRGRRVEYGTRYGQSGSLTASLRDVEPSGPTAREQRLAIEALRNSGRIVYLRNPFGDVFQVSLPSAQFDRVGGVGLREYLTLTLSYVEITA